MTKDSAVVKHGFLLFTLIALGALLWSLQSQPFAGLLAAATSAINPPSTAYFVPYKETDVRVGDVVNIDVNINALVPINAVGVTIEFPPQKLEIVGINKEKSFLDLWTEETVIREDAGEIHFSGGTTKKGGLEGVGTALTLSVRAKTEGPATLTFTEVEILANDGKGTRIDNASHSLALAITNPQPIFSIGAPTHLLQPPMPSPDFDGSGAVTLVDMSMLTIRIFSPYDHRFDLDSDGSVGLADLSILFTKMGTY